MTAYEEVVKNKEAHMCMHGAFADQESTDTYADVDSICVASFRSKLLRFTAADNDLVVNVLGSYDGGRNYDIAVEADIDVTVLGGEVSKTYVDPYTHLKVQIKAAVGGSQGTLTAKYFLVWL